MPTNASKLSTMGGENFEIYLSQMPKTAFKISTMVRGGQEKNYGGYAEFFCKTSFGTDPVNFFQLLHFFPPNRCIPNLFCPFFYHFLSFLNGQLEISPPPFMVVCDGKNVTVFLLIL